MANTYTQIHLHLVFAVKYRAALIHPTWREALYKYITAIIQNRDHKLLIINGMPDHLHMLIGMRPTQALSDLMQEVKGDSSKWINTQHFVRGQFRWQEGFGAFSYAKQDVPRIIRYIINQENHHRQVSFIDEYTKLLSDSGIGYDDQYTFKDPI